MTRPTGLLLLSLVSSWLLAGQARAAEAVSPSAARPAAAALAAARAAIGSAPADLRPGLLRHFAPGRFDAAAAQALTRALAEGQRPSAAAAPDDLLGDAGPVAGALAAGDPDAAAKFAAFVDAVRALKLPSSPALAASWATAERSLRDGAAYLNPAAPAVAGKEPSSPASGAALKPAPAADPAFRFVEARLGKEPAAVRAAVLRLMRLFLSFEEPRDLAASLMSPAHYDGVDNVAAMFRHLPVYDAETDRQLRLLVEELRRAMPPEPGADRGQDRGINHVDNVFTRTRVLYASFKVLERAEATGKEAAADLGSNRLIARPGYSVDDVADGRAERERKYAEETAALEGVARTPPRPWPVIMAALKAQAAAIGTANWEYLADGLRHRAEIMSFLRYYLDAHPRAARGNLEVIIGRMSSTGAIHRLWTDCLAAVERERATSKG